MKRGHLFAVWRHANKSHPVSYGQRVAGNKHWPPRNGREEHVALNEGGSAVRRAWFQMWRCAQSSFFAKVTCVENWLPRLRILRHRCLVDLYHIDFYMLFYFTRSNKCNTAVRWPGTKFESIGTCSKIHHRDWRDAVRMQGINCRVQHTPAVLPMRWWYSQKILTGPNHKYRPREMASHFMQMAAQWEFGCKLARTSTRWMTPPSFYAASVLGIMDPCLAQIRMLNFVNIIPVETNSDGRKTLAGPPSSPLGPRAHSLTWGHGKYYSEHHGRQNPVHGLAIAPLPATVCHDKWKSMTMYMENVKSWSYHRLGGRQKHATILHSNWNLQNA